MSIRVLFKGTLTLTLISIITQLGSLLLLPLYVSIISPEMFGIVGVLLPFTTIVVVIFNLGFPTAEARDLIELDKDANQVGSYLFTINVVLLMFSLAGFLLLIVPPVGRFVASLFGLDNIPFHYIILAYISGILMVFVNMLNIYLNFKQEFSKRAFVSLGAFVVSNIIALGIIFSSGDGTAGKLIGGIITQAILLVVLGYEYVRKFKPQFQITYLKSCLQLGLPMVVNGVFTTFANNGNRLVMNQFLPLDIIGQYTIAFTITSVIDIVFSSFHVVWIPIFFKNLDQNRSQREIESYIMTVVIFITACIFIGQLFIRDVAGLILNERYYEATSMSVILLPYFLTTALTSLLGNYLIYFKKTLWLSITNVVIGISALAANFIFIPLYGVNASIQLMTISKILVCAVFFIILREKYGLHFRYWIYGLLIGLVLNPLTMQIGGRPIDNSLYLLLKLAYSIVGVALLVILLPMKEKWIYRSKQFVRALIPA